MGSMLTLGSGLSGGFNVGSEAGDMVMILVSPFLLVSVSESRLDTGDLTLRVLCGPALEVEGLTRRTAGMLADAALDCPHGLGRRVGFITELLFSEQPEPADWTLLCDSMLVLFLCLAFSRARCCLFISFQYSLFCCRLFRPQGRTCGHLALL